jgi:creatinine amidohydrolase
MRFAALSPPALQRASATARLTVVPVGSVESNGDHLPTGVDGYVATAISVALATRLDALVAPLVPVGWSERLNGLAGVLTVEPHVVEAYCEGIARSLVASGLDRVLFVSGHGGNAFPLDLVCHRVERDMPGSCVAYVDVWSFIGALCDDVLESTHDRLGHGGELPTSLMLHLHPELVDMERARDGFPSADGNPQGFVRPRRPQDRMPAGVLGDSTLASRQKGALIFERAIDAIVAALEATDGRATRPRGADST